METHNSLRQSILARKPLYMKYGADAGTSSGRSRYAVVDALGSLGVGYERRTCRAREYIRGRRWFYVKAAQSRLNLSQILLGEF